VTNGTFINFKLQSIASRKCGRYIITVLTCQVCIVLVRCPCNVRAYEKFNASSVTFTHLDLVLTADVYTRVVRRVRICRIVYRPP